MRAASLPAGARVPHALAYHPVGLPKESSLPSLTSMADDCKLNTRAQRKFAAVVHIEEWLAIAMDLQGLDGAMRAREMSRLIGVSQPLAGAFLLSVPGPGQFRIRSSLFNIALQRRLGLPLRSRPGQGETLGDDELKQTEHTRRHNRVVAVWVRAVQAARGAANTRATFAATPYSSDAIPDFVSEWHGQGGAHEIGEVKCYNPVVADNAQLWRGATRAFGATEARLLESILGEAAAWPEHLGKPLPPLLSGQPRRAKYQTALDGGHTVQPLICEVWGGFALGATRYLNSLAQLRGDSIAEERSSCTWTTRSFVSYYGQLLSIAVNVGGAMEIERALGKSDA